MTSHRFAELAVVLCTDGFDTIRRVVSCLRAQTSRSQIEIVIVAPSRAALGADESLLGGFWGVKVLEVGEITSLAPARVAGIRAAEAPVIFLGETHSYPQPGWAEALIAAHRGDWAAVVPGIGNANPRTALSWGGLLTEYGSWIHGLPPGEIHRFPTWNTAYKRDVLVALGDRLEELLGSGDGLVRVLSTNGHRFYFEPAARLDHLNSAVFGRWFHERYIGGLSIASSRISSWSTWWRLAYVCGAPLIPAVVLSRSVRALLVTRRAVKLPAWTIPTMLGGAVVSAVGEMIGYAGGAGVATELTMTKLELHKLPVASSSAP
jgi:hypothetical protein